MPGSCCVRHTERTVDAPLRRKPGRQDFIGRCEALFDAASTQVASDLGMRQPRVLVDFTGLSLKNNDEIQMLRSLLPPSVMNPQVHLVLSANAKDSDATELGRRYSILGYKDVIFSGLDESTQHGTIYNFMRRFNTPLHSFGIGSRVPEDFEFATKERLLDLIFRITQLQQKDSEAI